MGLPTTEHFLFIPAVLLLGMALGYKLGVKAAQDKMAEKAKRARE